MAQVGIDVDAPASYLALCWWGYPDVNPALYVTREGGSVPHSRVDNNGTSLAQTNYYESLQIETKTNRSIACSPLRQTQVV